MRVKYSSRYRLYSSRLNIIVAAVAVFVLVVVVVLVAVVGGQTLFLLCGTVTLSMFITSLFHSVNFKT